MVVAPPFGAAGVGPVVEVALDAAAPTPEVVAASGEFEFSNLLDVEFLTDSRLPLLLGECFNAEKIQLKKSIHISIKFITDIIFFVSLFIIILSLD